MTKLLKIMSLANVLEENLASACIICLFAGKFLVGYNNWRKQWEVPAGKREPQETIFETAQREFLEETHQTLTDLKLVKIAKIQDKTTRFRAVFLGTIAAPIPFVKEDQDEMDKIAFCTWDELDQMNVAELDLQILKIVMR